MELKDLIDSDPANASKSDDDILAWLNQPAAPIQYHEFSYTLVGLGAVMPDKALLDAITNGFIGAAANDIYVNEALILVRSGTPINWANPLVLQIMNATLSQTQYDQFISYLKPLSRLDIAGIGSIKMGDVIKARQ